MPVQTRRDQLQAYRFQNRRALAALVTGRPNVIEPPMRRLTVTTISGIMIAVLIAVGFALVGLIRPAANTEWRQANSVIVENDTGARYVYIDGVLHPALNYASAILAAGSGQPPQLIHVDRSQLDGVRRGSLIGVPGLPDSVPAPSDLVTAPWTVCSRLVPTPGTSTVRAAVTVTGGSDAGATALSGGASVLVQPVGTTTRFLLAGGERFEVGSDAVAAALGLQSAPVLRVGSAFVDAVPEGPVLHAPPLPHAGDPFRAHVGGHSVRVGQLLQTGTRTFYLVLDDGVAAVTPLEAALLQTLPAGPGHSTLTPVQTTTSAALDAGASATTWPKVVAPRFADLPRALPPVDTQPAGNGGLCAVYRADATQPTFAAPASRLPDVTPTAFTQSARSAAGQADEVVLPPGSGALVRSTNGSSTVYLVAYPGAKYAAASSGVLTLFGYGGVKPDPLPPELIALLPPGPALDQQAARRPVTG